MGDIFGLNGKVLFHDQTIIVKELFQIAGSIIYHSQLIEHNLRVIIYLDTLLKQKGKKLAKDELSAEDLFHAIQKESMGTLIDTLQEFDVFGKADLKYLRSVTPKRNSIAHSYFKDASLEERFNNPSEMQKMLSELKQIERDFIHLHKENVRIISDYENEGARK